MTVALILLASATRVLRNSPARRSWTDEGKILEMRSDTFIGDVHGSDGSGPMSGGREDHQPGELLEDCEDTLIEWTRL